ncbi:MAG: hypothetical protein V8R55_10705 [Dysosmobacter sp.]
MEIENQSTFISQMLQDLQASVADEETSIPMLGDSVTPMTIDESAPGDVIELSDEFDFGGYKSFEGNSLHTPLNRPLPSTITRSMSILLV